MEVLYIFLGKLMKSFYAGSSLIFARLAFESVEKSVIVFYCCLFGISFIHLLDEYFNFERRQK